jgi:hypothetical protein
VLTGRMGTLEERASVLANSSLHDKRENQPAPQCHSNGGAAGVPARRRLGLSLSRRARGPCHRAHIALNLVSQLAFSGF